MFKWLLELLLGCMLLPGLLGQALAEEYPARTIRIIVGYGAGGGADFNQRIVAQKMSENMGTAVIIENMPSAGGILAAVTAAKARSDGYTLYMVSTQNVMSQAMMKSLPYDPVRDFSLISLTGSFDLVMVTDSSSPFKNVNDVLLAARRDPSHFNIGTVGVGSTQYLSAELFKSMANLTVPTVPFKGSGEVIAALMSGTVQVGFETLPAVIEQIKAGKLRALAVTSEKRSPALPKIATIAESGVPNYHTTSWNGLAAPAKTAPEIITRLNREIVKVLASPDIQKRLQAMGVEPKSSSPEFFKALLESEIVKWRGVVEHAKIDKL